MARGLRIKFVTRSGARSAFYSVVPGVKQPGREGNHSLPSSVEVTNYQSYISTTAPCPPRTRLHGADMDTFTCFTCNNNNNNNNNNISVFA